MQREEVACLGSHSTGRVRARCYPHVADSKAPASTLLSLPCQGAVAGVSGGEKKGNGGSFRPLGLPGPDPLDETPWAPTERVGFEVSDHTLMERRQREPAGPHDRGPRAVAHS